MSEDIIELVKELKDQVSELKDQVSKNNSKLDQVLEIVKNNQNTMDQLVKYQRGMAPENKE